MMLKYVNVVLVRLFALCFVVPFLIDRITKQLIVSEVWQSCVLTDFFNIYFTYNQGIAWGIGGDLDSGYLIAGMILIAVILMYFAWYMRLIAYHRGMLGSCLFILSGGISNFLDRVWFGGVVDFLQFHIGSWYFPVFNVADVAITIGALCLSYFFLSEDKA